MMKWLDDIRVAYKLAILAVVTVVGMMIIGGSGYFAIKKVLPCKNVILRVKTVKRRSEVVQRKYEDCNKPE